MQQCPPCYTGPHTSAHASSPTHTHGVQIRLPGGPPIVRHSRFCLDEGLYVHGSTMLAVTRGLGAVGLPWRMGADPEAILLCIRAVRSGQPRAAGLPSP